MVRITHILKGYSKENKNLKERERKNEYHSMSTYWPLYISASNVIEKDNEKFLNRNREEKRKISFSSRPIKSSSFDQTGTHRYSTHR